MPPLRWHIAFQESWLNSFEEGPLRRCASSSEPPYWKDNCWCGVAAARISGQSLPPPPPPALLSLSSFSNLCLVLCFLHDFRTAFLSCAHAGVMKKTWGLPVSKTAHIQCCEAEYEASHLALIHGVTAQTMTFYSCFLVESKRLDVQCGWLIKGTANIASRFLYLIKEKSIWYNILGWYLCK